MITKIVSQSDVYLNHGAGPKKKKKEETDPPPYFREAEIREREESRVAIPPSSPSYSAVAAEMLPRGVGFSGTHKTAAPERQNVLDLPLLSLQVHRSIIKTYWIPKVKRSVTLP